MGSKGSKGDRARPDGTGELELELEIESFEDAIRELEEIVHQLEEGTLSLNASIEGFERGMGLVRYCARELRRVEERVKVLTEEAGRLRLADFEPETD